MKTSKNLAAEKILVTGGTGFLGRYVLNRLIETSAVPTVISRNPSAEFRKFYGSKINVRQIDLLDAVQLKSFFEKLQPERVIHLAGSTGKQANQTTTADQINYEATAHLLELAAENRVKRIVITGTADEYGFQTPPQSETLPAQPNSDYARSKNKAVNFAVSLYEKYGLPVVILRPFTVYGVGQPPRMFIAEAVECAVKNIPFEMSEGFQKRDPVFVEDCADAMIKALTVDGIEGEIFNVGGGRSIALAEIAKKIWLIAGADKNLLRIGARQTAANELHDTESDSSKIREFLDWQPKTLLDEGLKYVIESVRTREK